MFFVMFFESLGLVEEAGNNCLFMEHFSLQNDEFEKRKYNKK